jgi:hypothetical protein
MPGRGHNGHRERHLPYSGEAGGEPWTRHADTRGCPADSRVGVLLFLSSTAPWLLRGVGGEHGLGVVHGVEALHPTIHTWSWSCRCYLGRMLSRREDPQEIPTIYTPEPEEGAANVALDSHLLAARWELLCPGCVHGPVLRRAMHEAFRIWQVRTNKAIPNRELSILIFYTWFGLLFESKVDGEAVRPVPRCNSHGWDLSFI